MGRGSLHDSADGPRRGEPAVNTRCRSRDASVDCPKTVALGQGIRSRARTHRTHAHARTRTRTCALARTYALARTIVNAGDRGRSATIRNTCASARMHLYTYTLHARTPERPNVSARVSSKASRRSVKSVSALFRSVSALVQDESKTSKTSVETLLKSPSECRDAEGQRGGRGGLPILRDEELESDWNPPPHPCTSAQS